MMDNPKTPLGASYSGSTVNIFFVLFINLRNCLPKKRKMLSQNKNQGIQGVFIW